MEKQRGDAFPLKGEPSTGKATSRARFKAVLNLWANAIAMIVLVYLIAVYYILPLAPDDRPVGTFRSRGLSTAAAASSGPLLDVFQVYPPVLTPDTNPSVPSTGCDIKKQIMKHVFAFSYNQPFVGIVTPPDCDFNRVVWNLTIVSAGRQFDRLAIVYLGNTEVWRTSTAEPTQSGIEQVSTDEDLRCGIADLLSRFTYTKDVSNFLALFKKEQKLIFDLGNLIDSTYTASFNATLTAQYFTSPDTVQPADEIIPISARMGAKNQSSVFSLPSQNASNAVTLPRNIERAVFSISSCGQIGEEFWFGNTFNSLVNTFETNPAVGTLYGFSPFREVQLFIDGMMAGVVWPFPIIFTGGVVPGLWRPIVGINTYDLKEDEIDITPFLPLLCDGAKHTFEIRVAGINDTAHGGGILTETVGSYWLVTGTIFLWLSETGSVTTGSGFHSSVPPPSIALSHVIGKNSTGGNKTLTYNTQVSRELFINADIKTSSGRRSVIWHQDLQYSNLGKFTKYGNVQLIRQNTTGYDYALGYSKSYSYPIDVVTGISLDPTSGNFSLTANISRGLSEQYVGFPVFPTGLQSFEALPKARKNYPTFQGSSLSTSQNGSASYFAAPSLGLATGYGSTHQDMTFSGILAGKTKSARPQVKGSQELYERHVTAVNSTIVEDSQILVGTPYRGPQPAAANRIPAAAYAFAPVAPAQIIGRGPGRRSGSLLNQ